MAPGGVVHHVTNRGSRKGFLFETPEDYTAFLRVLQEARVRRPMRIIAYCLMVNHWHLLLWPFLDGDLSRFMHWLTGTHASRWRRAHHSTGEGAVYQSRFDAIPVCDDMHLLNVWRYIERNPLAAKQVLRAEDWPWSSACASGAEGILTVDPGPLPRPTGWLSLVNGHTTDGLLRLLAAGAALPNSREGAPG